MKGVLEEFNRIGRRAVGERNEVGLPQEALNVSVYLSVLRIRYVCPGSRIRIFSIPDLGNMIRVHIPDPGPDFLLIPDPGIKKALDPGSETLLFILLDPERLSRIRLKTQL